MKTLGYLFYKFIFMPNRHHVRTADWVKHKESIFVKQITQLLYLNINKFHREPTVSSIGKLSVIIKTWNYIDKVLTPTYPRDLFETISRF